MPTVGVKCDELFKGLGKVYSREEFDELCFDFGIELDEVVEEEDEPSRNKIPGGEKTTHTVFKIDIPANRYDLLCLEGIIRSLNIFLGRESIPIYTLATPAVHTMTVKADTASIRPYVVCAVLRNVTLDHTSYNSFLDLQDKLHFNICRRRTLVAIGTHDLDTIEGPFTYEALTPEEINFVPLLPSNKSYNAKELLNYYRDKSNEDGKHIRPYTDIIYDAPKYPVIYDSKRRVLSLPPIINGDHSKMSMATKNIFIECTATDANKAGIVLNTMISMFSGYCATPFSIEPVEVIYEDTSMISSVTPVMKEPQMEVGIDQVNKLIGINIETDEVVTLLKKMQLNSTLNETKDVVTVTIPITRSDILHPVDIIEDVAIAYGYNNVERVMPPTVARGRELPINSLTEMLRIDLAAAGYTECLTLGLCSTDEAFSMLRQENDGKTAVTLSNPKTQEYQVCRTSLLSGLLKTLAENKSQPLKDGLKLFEISDVVFLDPLNDIGARNQRNCAAMYIGPTAGVEKIHGLVDRVMQLLNIEPAEDYCGVRTSGTTKEYYIRPSTNPTYFPAFAAEIVLRSKDKTCETVIGHFGAVHPDVLSKKAFDVKWPCSAMEINIQGFAASV